MPGELSAHTAMSLSASQAAVCGSGLQFGSLAGRGLHERGTLNRRLCIRSKTVGLRPSETLRPARGLRPSTVRELAAWPKLWPQVPRQRAARGRAARYCYHPRHLLVSYQTRNKSVFSSSRRAVLASGSASLGSAHVVERPPRPEACRAVSRHRARCGGREAGAAALDSEVVDAAPKAGAPTREEHQGADGAEPEP